MFGGGFNNINQAGMGYQRPNPVLDNWKKYLEQLAQLGVPQNYLMDLYNALAGLSGKDVNTQIQGLNQIMNMLQQLYTQANGNINIQNGIVQAGKFIENLLQQAKSKVSSSSFGGFGGTGFGASGFGSNGFVPNGLTNTGFGASGWNVSAPRTTTTTTGFSSSFLETTGTQKNEPMDTNVNTSTKTVDEIPYDPEIAKEFKCEDPIVLPPVYDAGKERLFMIVNYANKTFKYVIRKI